MKFVKTANGLECGPLVIKNFSDGTKIKRRKPGDGPWKVRHTLSGLGANMGGGYRTQAFARQCVVALLSSPACVRYLSAVPADGGDPVYAGREADYKEFRKVAFESRPQAIEVKSVQS